jgi:hypothetical protein
VLAGAGVLRIDIPSYCTGDAGSTWCPEHGECSCKPEGAQPACPLHGEASRHGADGCEFAATQFYAPSALYCLTPATETEARRAAREARSAPFVRYQNPRALVAAPDAFDPADDDIQDEDTTCDVCGAPPGECADDCSRNGTGEEPPTPDSQADGHRDPDA